MTKDEIQKNSEHWYNKYKDLETENNKLLDVINNQDVKIADLEQKLEQTEDLIKNIIRVTWGEGWNYSLDWKVKAEQFLRETDIDNAIQKANEGLDLDKIADLEKQVKDLEWQLQEVAKDNDYYQAENKRLEQQIEKMKERIEELETRCAELFLQNNEFAEHLSKAKEIIRDLLGCLYSVEYDRVSDLEQAEQFLKEGE